jgi:hypothetical protein
MLNFQCKFPSMTAFVIILAAVVLVASSVPVRAETPSESDLREAFNKLRLLVTDVPGPEGLPYPGEDWRIVTGPKELDALVNRQVLLKGVTDDHGEARIDASGHDTLYAAWKEKPLEIWFCALSHCSRFEPKQQAGQLQISLVQPKSAFELAFEAKKAEADANWKKFLSPDFYRQAGFDAPVFEREFADWKERFRADLKAFHDRAKADPGFIPALRKKNDLSATLGVMFMTSIDPGTKGQMLRALLVEAVANDNNGAWQPAVVTGELMSRAKAKPVGFGGTFKLEGKEIELLYVLFDDLAGWTLQDLREEPTFKAFNPATLPAYGEMKRNVWPALVFVRDNDGKVMLYGVSQELARIIEEFTGSRLY